MKLIENAIRELTEQRDKLNLAIKALAHLDSFADANLKSAHKTKSRRKVSKATRVKMRAAQQARWQKAKKVKRG